jgi:DNA (cytosine-5)-methyltransferase 1
MGKLTVLDLFCGAGGFSLGLDDRYFDIAFGLENWKPAADTFRKSHPNASVIEADAQVFVDALVTRDSKLPRKGDIDLIVGGPPCQGFCGMNRHRDIADKRNSLVEIFVQVVQLLEPSIVCMENVTGLLSLGDGLYHKQLLDSLEEAGYETDFRIMQVGYYGVPQNRWRVFVVGVKLGLGKPSFPEPIHQFHKTAVHNAGAFKKNILRPITQEPSLFWEPLRSINVRDAIGDLPSLLNGGEYNGPYQLPAQGGFQALARQDSTEISAHKTSEVRPLHLERFRHIPKNKPDSGWLDLPDHLKPDNLKNFNDKPVATKSSYNNRFGRLNWDGTFNAIMAKVEPYWGRVIHPEDDRLLSARECARAQGFSDKVSFSGTQGDVCRQIGNAVPVAMSRAMGETLLKSLGRKTDIINDYIESFRSAESK